ncbi:efflux RND transporter permease subunit [Polymorphospora rubra]|uniref:efflux RND transporter permease subunit n=1 Tax=Polymorphospora rubra TaxID=338584 RepID=UPI00340F0501
MSRLSSISLANRKLAALISLLVLAIGAFAIPSLKQQVLPDLNLPLLGVVAADPGSSPVVIEQQVVEPLEATLRDLDGVQNTTSVSRQGAATVVLSFDYGTDLVAAQARVSTAVGRAAGLLPAGVVPQVFAISTSDLPTLTLAATSTTVDQQVLAERVRLRLVPELSGIDGVNEVTVTGERAQVVSVIPDPAALAGAGLTPEAVGAALAAVGRTQPAGVLAGDRAVISVQVGGPLTTLAQIEDLRVAPAAGGTAVRLGDVATVELADAAATSLTRTNGEPSLGISLTMDQGGSSSYISTQVGEKLDDLRAALGDGSELEIVSDFGPAVQNSIKGLLTEGLLGMAMAVLVIMFFLRSVRSTVVTAVSIPLSLVVALVVLWQQELSLNVLTLGGLTIAVGRVVDDSIVVLENIKRHLGYGTAKREAVVTGVREVAGAITSSTLTTVAVFLPIVAVSGVVGELFTPFSITVAVAMLASLVVSLTIIPVLAYWFLRPPAVGADPERFRHEAEEAERQGAMQARYVPTIRWALAHRGRVLALGGVVLVLTVALGGALKTSFIGDSDTDTLTVTQRLAPGSSLTATDAAAREVERVVGGLDGVESYQLTIGSGDGFGAAFSTTGADTATYLLNLTGDADPARVEADLTRRLAGLGPAAGELTVGAGGGTDTGIQVTVTAGDEAALRTATESVLAALREVDEVHNVTSDLARSAPQIGIVARPEAARHGLTDQLLALAVGRAVTGSTVSTVILDGTRHDVVVQPVAAAPTSVADLNRLTLPTAAGPVRLDRVATVTLADAATTRTRVDGVATVTVTAAPVGDDTGAATTAVREALSGVALPGGADWALGGVTADQDEAFRQLGLAMAAAVALVFVILLATFRSIRQTLVLLVSVPFAATGAILLLLVTGTPLGLAALIGMLMLIGIVVTNAIVLIDLVNQYREQGMEITEAVVEGGRRRLRPIVMTALATIFALTPMALGVTDHGGFISQPLAVVVIGGLVSSTVLTLLLVPTLYTMVESRRGRRRRGGRVERPEPVPPARTDPLVDAVR